MKNEELNKIIELIKSNEIVLAAQLWVGLGRNLDDLVIYIKNGIKFRSFHEIDSFKLSIIYGIYPTASLHINNTRKLSIKSMESEYLIKPLFLSMLHYMVYDKIICNKIRDVEMRQIIYDGLVSKLDFVYKENIENNE